jgi:hypothetical protein
LVVGHAELGELLGLVLSAESVGGAVVRAQSAGAGLPMAAKAGGSLAWAANGTSSLQRLSALTALVPGLAETGEARGPHLLRCLVLTEACESVVDWWPCSSEGKGLLDSWSLSSNLTFVPAPRALGLGLLGVAGWCPRRRGR